MACWFTGGWIALQHVTFCPVALMTQKGSVSDFVLALKPNKNRLGPRELIKPMFRPSCSAGRASTMWGCQSYRSIGLRLRMNMVSQNRFGRPVLHQPAYSPHPGWIWWELDRSCQLPLACYPPPPEGHQNGARKRCTGWFSHRFIIANMILLLLSQGDTVDPTQP